ncbi:MAG: cell division protein SepF [Candidatus Methylarchaceae archaeon HK02M2]|nr:cell division protein SepF [Candidatus Methylarchaceae archaeon HK02M2]
MARNITETDDGKEHEDLVYLKAFSLKSFDELSKIKNDVNKKMIIILKITPLAQKDVEELKRAVEELYEFSVSIGGDIARLGEERIVITPPNVKIWRGSI